MHADIFRKSMDIKKKNPVFFVKERVKEINSCAVNEPDVAFNWYYRCLK